MRSSFPLASAKEEVSAHHFVSAATLNLLCYKQVRLGHELGAARTHLTAAKNKFQVDKLSVNTADTDLKDFCADHDKARWVFNFCVAGTQPPPIKGGTAEAPTQKLQTILALGNASEADFVVLEKMFTLMTALITLK